MKNWIKSIISKIKLKLEKGKIPFKYYKQKYPIGCSTQSGKITKCDSCKYCGPKECQCPYPFQEVISSNIQEFVLVDKDYRGISDFTTYQRKIEVVAKRKQSRRLKLDAKRKLLAAGASYLAAMELCKELGLDIKEL